MSAANGRLEIPVGADSTLVFRMKGQNSKDYVDLTGALKIEIQLDTRNRGVMTFTNVAKPAIAAEYTYNSVIYTAVTAGPDGDLISLVFDGIKTISAVIAAWNAANSANTVSCNATDVTVVPPAGTVELAGGHIAYMPVSVFGSPIQGKIQLIITEADSYQLRLGNNQSMKIFVDFSSGGNRKRGILQNLVDIN